MSDTPKAEYREMRGMSARIRLNELGYPVKGSDGLAEGTLGMIVVLAEKINELEAEVQKLKAERKPT